MTDLRQALYLIADEMRGMATIGDYFANNIYETERAQRILDLAIKVAALAEDGSETEIKTIFEARPWQRFSPAIGVDAAVFNSNGAILLIQRKDNGAWAMPGGVAEIGQTLPESVLRELWEEAGLRGTVTRLLGIFDGRFWHSPAKVHVMNVVFQVNCNDLTPAAGVECLDAQFFARDQLPQVMHSGHELRVPKCFQLLDSGETYFDPAESVNIDMPAHQRVAD